MKFDASHLSNFLTIKIKLKMEIKTLATFVAPAVKMVVDYEDLQDKELSEERRKDSKEEIERFSEIVEAFDRYPMLENRFKNLRCGECVFIIVSSRNNLQYISRYFFTQFFIGIEDTYCLDTWADASDIIDKECMQDIIATQACKFIVIGKKEKILDFVKHNFRCDPLNDEFKKYYTREI